MSRPESSNPDNSRLVSSHCQPTISRLQRVLDGEQSLAGLDTDPHALLCPTCRERIRAALALLAYTASPPQLIVPRTEFADAVLDAMRAERRDTQRRRLVTATAGLVIAASVAVAVWFHRPMVPPPAEPNSEVVITTPPATQPAAVEPLPMADQLNRVTVAFRDTARPITEPASTTTTILGTLVGALARAVASPRPDQPEPPRNSLVELSEAARLGFEPITGTARKGFNRLMREVSAIQPGGSN